VIQIKQKSRELAVVLESMASAERDVPEYIQVEPNQCKATFIRTPAVADVPYPVQMDPHLVVEYYSR
jgi:small subunit ribosomal protein S4